MKIKTTMRAALEDPALLGNLLAGESWSAWRVVLIAAMGEPLTTAERTVFAKLTGREREPRERVEELWAIIGRRGGKSRSVAVLAAYLAGLCDYSDVLVPGETGVVVAIAPDQKQASIIFGYALASFEASPILRNLVARSTSDTLELTTGITIEVRSASFRRLRGPTYVAVLADEAAFWLSEESANPDREILDAVRPGLATTRGMLICASSPYARKGELHATHKKHFGPEGDPKILVLQGASRALNPSLPQSVVDRALERDPQAAAAEYLAQFRTDVAAFLDLDAIEACVSSGVHERAPIEGVRYFAFADPSGGARDSFTAAVAHMDDKLAVLDAVREFRPPFSPEVVVKELSEFFKSYRVSSIHGDRYSGEFVRELFRNNGVTYRASQIPKSDIYLAALPAINSRLVDLLDNKRLVQQLTALERRTARGGKDSVDHPPQGHDDLANAAAGALYEARLSKKITPHYSVFGPIKVNGGYDSDALQVGVR